MKAIEADRFALTDSFFIENKETISLFAQTGIWRNELLTPDEDDIDMMERRIKPKPTAMVFFM